MNESRTRLDWFIEDHFSDISRATDDEYAIWKAGRESMRKEIIPLVYGMCESDNVAARTVEAIRKIEP